jgi:hypothetical protein
MKAAVLGTIDYHTTMQQAAKNALQRQAGYIPQVCNSAIEIELPCVHETFTKHADGITQSLAYMENARDCNPRSLYLYLAWLLIGSDNPFRLNRYLENDAFHQRIAFQYFGIALGLVLPTGIYQRSLGFDLRHGRFIAERIAELAYELVHTHFRHYFGYNNLPGYLKLRTTDIRNDVVTYTAYFARQYPEDYMEEFSMSSGSAYRLHITYFLSKQLRRWMYLSDMELLPIFRQLMLDLYSTSAL